MNQLRNRPTYPTAAGLLTLILSARLLSAEPGSVEETARTLRDPKDIAAVERLRAAGPRGLQLYLEAHSGELTTAPAEFVGARKERSPAEEILDEIAGQRDARFSRLFWYTDLEKARQEAAATGKSILSLRLLGRLTDDLSCANSRFFRTVLYANESVGQLLRDRFVLHWESVRPAPIIEIDFRDGRKVRRTITGNSIHYVLDSRGRVVDGLPGLYGPGTFLTLLRGADEAARAMAPLEDGEFRTRLADYHRQERTKTEEWRGRLLAEGAEDDPTQAPASAEDAQLRALARGFVEEARLDTGSRTMVAHKNPELAMRLAIAKSMAETPMFRMIRNLERNLAVDTAKNEFELHPRLRKWFEEAQAPLELRALNERVYSELFQTPSSDPWLGLVPPDVYAALDGQGILRNGFPDAIPAHHPSTEHPSGVQRPQNSGH